MNLEGRRGDVSDGIVFIVILFFLAVSFIVVGFANTKISHIIETTALNQSDAAAGILQASEKLSSSGINFAFTILFALSILSIMITSFLVRIHPAWFFLYLLFLGIAIFLAVILSNVYGAIEDNAQLALITQQQTMITWVMHHSVKIVIATILLSMVLLFAKPPETTVI